MRVDFVSGLGSPTIHTSQLCVCVCVCVFVCLCVSEASVAADSGNGVYAGCGLGLLQCDRLPGQRPAFPVGPRLQCLHHQHVPVSTD